MREFHLSIHSFIKQSYMQELSHAVSEISLAARINVTQYYY